MPRKNNRNPKKNMDTKNVSPDLRLATATLHLDCIFDRGVNFKERIITVTNDIEYPLFDIVDAALTEMESESRKAVTIKIHSLGGYVYESLAIVGRLKKSKCKIITEGYGTVMSAATLILACGDERRFSKFGWFMHHESKYEFGGRHSEMKDIVEQGEREEQQWAYWMSKFSNKSEKFWATEGVRKDKYFLAEELLKLGVIDEII